MLGSYLLYNELYYNGLMTDVGLLSHHHFGVAQHFVVEHIARLHAVDDVILLLLIFCGEESYSFVEISVKLSFLSFHLLQTLLFECALQLLEN